MGKQPSRKIKVESNGSIFIVCCTGILLFGGEPSLYDALMYWLTDGVVPLPEPKQDRE